MIISIFRALLKVVGEQRDDWDVKLNSILLAARTTIQRSTGYNPYGIVFGREATLPYQVAAAPTVPIADVSDDVMQHLSTISTELHEKVFTNIMQAQEPLKKEHRRKHDKGSVTYKKGELALLRNFNRLNRKANKLTGDKWKGRYVLVAITDRGLALRSFKKQRQFCRRNTM